MVQLMSDFDAIHFVETRIRKEIIGDPFSTALYIRKEYFFSKQTKKTS